MNSQALNRNNSIHNPSRLIGSGDLYAKRRLALLGAGLAALGAAGLVHDRVQDIREDQKTVEYQEGDPGTEKIVVHSGDTAWEIADGRTDGDKRALVDSIMSQPDAQDGLHPGDELVVPVDEDKTEK